MFKRKGGGSVKAWLDDLGHFFFQVQVIIQIAQDALGT